MEIPESSVTGSWVWYVRLPQRSGGAVPSMTSETIMKRVLMAIGVNTYQNGIPALDWAVPDATAIAGFFTYRMGYDRVVSVLLPEKQSASQINEQIAAEAAALGPGDLLTLYFAGHACVHKERAPEQQLLLLPRAHPRLIDCYDESLNLKSIALRTARPGLARWLIIDACRTALPSGARDYTGHRRRPDGLAWEGFTLGCQRLAETSRDEAPLWVLNSCSDNEVAMECRDLEGGLFTRALMQVLSGPKRVESEAGLIGELKAHMRDLATTYDLALAQTPTLSGTGCFPKIWGPDAGSSPVGPGAVMDDVRTWEVGRLQSQASGLAFELGRRWALASDWERARSHFRQAADLGHVAALAMLGQCLMYGQGGPVDLAGAESCFRRALEIRPVPTAWNNLGVLLEQSHDPARRSEAVPCFLAAAQMGHAKAMLNYALRLSRTDPHASAEAALRWLSASRAAGCAEASSIFEHLQQCSGNPG
jgi:tetratricopeptide (TPR) repeat protein